MKIFLALLLSIISASAATYYVDFDAGNDASAGTSTGAAWRTIPGTRTTAGTAYLRSAWGPFDGSTKVPSGTTIQVKAGTTHTSAAGGYVWIGRDYYTETGATITIKSDSSWGTGSSATINAGGMTVGISAVLTQIDGLTFDGFNVNNSTVEGLEAKEHQGTGNPQLNTAFRNLTFFNNGTSYPNDAAGSGAGQLSLRYPSTCTVSNVVCNGNNRFINGILIGDGHKYPTGVTVQNCTSHDHQGDFATNDCGIGFKCFNSQITFKGCTSYNNLKGWDSGEDHGDQVAINVKVINSTAYSCSEGFNFNGPGASWAGAINFYLINCLSYGNTNKGTRTYAGPYNLYIVNSVFDNNGFGDSQEGCNIHVTPDTSTETFQIRTYLYNNISRRPTGSALFVPFASASNNLTVDSDYNSWQQNSSEYFCRWGYYGGQTIDFSYGSNGPGRSSGNWYSYYGNSSTALPSGVGHFHNDSHSKGTLSTVTNLPSLNSSYQLTASYAGLNLSSKSWYVSEMGIDRVGNARSSWDMGMNDVTGAVVVPVTSSPTRRAISATEVKSITDAMAMLNPVPTNAFWKWLVDAKAVLGNIYWPSVQMNQ